MDPTERRELYRRLAAIEARAVQFRKAVVVSTSPLTIAIAGSETPLAANAVAGSSFTVDDHVACLTWKGDLIVLGAIE